MNVLDNGADQASAPANYADLHRQYYKYVVAFVHKLGIHENNAEDVASDILLKFYERNFLDKYDPDMTFEYKGQLHPARFKNFLSQFVFLYTKGHLDRQRRIRIRERAILDQPTTKSGGAFGRQVYTMGDLLLPPEADHAEYIEDELVADDLVNELRDYLRTVPPRNDYDMLDLVELFDEVVAQVKEYGEYNTTLLRERFAVSHTAMHTWIWLLKGHLCNCLRRELPAKRRRTLPNRRVS